MKNKLIKLIKIFLKQQKFNKKMIMKKPQYMKINIHD